ncbi:hypothetical protein CRG98_027030 [Punica granatum]|uniref:Uncharacterized protein n=1 Tax=Punica granatum TaxID=22663 RepID=A0A2I0J8L9_PUNGR|nr:hypothetical protein CRG98_027030 [Punica granatum]
MFYQASGCEERVGEGFESRVTRWNPQKDVRVQGHARSDELGMRLGLHGRADAQAGARAEAWGTGERTGSRGAQASAQQCARGASKCASTRANECAVTGVTIHPRSRSSPKIT